MSPGPIMTPEQLITQYAAPTMARLIAQARVRIVDSPEVTVFDMPDSHRTRVTLTFDVEPVQ